MSKILDQTCILTGHYFHPESHDEVISPQGYDILASAIVKLMNDNSTLREKVTTAILCDERMTSSIARSLFAVKAKDIGLLTSGSIADLFCKCVRKHDKEKTSEDNGEVGTVSKKKVKR